RPPSSAPPPPPPPFPPRRSSDLHPGRTGRRDGTLVDRQPVERLPEHCRQIHSGCRSKAEPRPWTRIDVEQLQDAAAGIALELDRSEEHTSELQSREKLVCRLPLE